MRAWIGLGSNIGAGPELLDEALAYLDSSPSISLLRQSSYYCTEPWGEVVQDEFTNAVAEVNSALEPLELLRYLQSIEQRLGRVRTGQQWGPRTIDLDLLTCNDLVLDTPGLQLPHPRMHQRRFVLVPLLEIEPDFVIPGKGAATDYLAVLQGQKVSILDL